MVRLAICVVRLAICVVRLAICAVRLAFCAVRLAICVVRVVSESGLVATMLEDLTFVNLVFRAFPMCARANASPNSRRVFFKPRGTGFFFKGVFSRGSFRKVSKGLERSQ